MRLSDVLSKDYLVNYEQVEGFIKAKPKYGIAKRIEVGKIAVNCKCGICNDVRTFASEKELQLIMIRDEMFSIDTRLTCSVCGESVAAWFLVDTDGGIDSLRPKVRLIKKCIKYSDTVGPVFNIAEEYAQLLEKAEIAYRENLGAGSIIYLRKIFEIVTDSIADENGINILGSNGKKICFRDRLQRVDMAVHFIPPEFSADGYRLFGELSDVIHGEFDEADGLAKYQMLKRLVIGIIENVKNQSEYDEAKRNLGWIAGVGA